MSRRAVASVAAHSVAVERRVSFDVSILILYDCQPRYVRADGGVLHLALALAIGKYGEVYAGGFGENGYPAVAYIGG